MRINKEDIINSSLINIILFLLVCLNVVGSDISFRLVLDLNLKEIYAYGYDICFGLIITSIVWLVNSYRLKKYLIIVFSFLYQALSFYLLMKVQNDIFLILLVNDIGNFIFQIGLFILIFVFTIVCLILLDKRLKQIKLPIIFSLMAIISLVGGILGYSAIKNYVKQDYELTKLNRHPGYVEKYRHSLDDYEVIEKLMAKQNLEAEEDSSLALSQKQNQTASAPLQPNAPANNAPVHTATVKKIVKIIKPSAPQNPQAVPNKVDE